MLGRIAEGIAVEGMESLTPALVDGMELLVDVLPEGTHVVVCDPERVRSRAHDLVATSQEFLEASWVSAAAGQRGAGRPRPLLGTASYRTLADVREHAIAAGVPWWTLSPFAVDVEARETGLLQDDGVAVLAPDVQDVTAYRGDADRRRSRTCSSGCTTAGGSWWSPRAAGLGRAASSRCSARRDLAARLAPDLAEAPEPSGRHVTTGGLGRGFVASGVKLAVAHRGRPHRRLGGAAPPATCAGCRAGAATSSTRCSSARATSSSTSSTASAGSSR